MSGYTRFLVWGNLQKLQGFASKRHLIVGVVMVSLLTLVLSVNTLASPSPTVGERAIQSTELINPTDSPSDSLGANGSVSTSAMRASVVSKKHNSAVIASLNTSAASSDNLPLLSSVPSPAVLAATASAAPAQENFNTSSTDTNKTDTSKADTNQAQETGPAASDGSDSPLSPKVHIQMVLPLNPLADPSDQGVPNLHK